MSEPALIYIPESENHTNYEEILSSFDNIESQTNQPDVKFHKSVLCKKQNCKYFKYETNAKQRQKIKTNLLNQLEQVIEEYYERVKGDAVIIAMSDEFESNFRFVGTCRLKAVAKEFITDIHKNINTAMETNECPDDPLENTTVSNLFPLPPLRVNDEPITLSKMTQAHLRAFIPLMLKYSLGRGKPGWGKNEMRPVWWPNDVPWANIRTDIRTPEEKALMTWSSTLRKIVKCCYEYHGRQDLISDELLDPLQLEVKTNEEKTNNVELMTPDGPVTLYCTVVAAADNSSVLPDINQEDDAVNDSEGAAK